MTMRRRRGRMQKRLATSGSTPLRLPQPPRGLYFSKGTHVPQPPPPVPGRTPHPPSAKGRTRRGESATRPDLSAA